MKLVALFNAGLEKLVKNELKSNGINSMENSRGMIFFDGDLDLIYKLNLNSRLIEKILICVGEFKAETYDELFDNIYSLNWSDFIKKDDGVIINKISSKRSKLFSEKTIQSIVQKAIYKKLMDKYSLNYIQENSKINIRIYSFKDNFMILLDTTGIPLSKRGYRKLISQAPLKETLAASLLFFSHWKRKYPLYDPFCGSGTIPIEAASYAFNIPPGINRNFDFSLLKNFDADLFNIIKKDLKGKINTSYEINIFGSDKEQHMIETSFKNSEYYEINDKINFYKCSMEEIRNKGFDFGYVISNPPYGERYRDSNYAIKIYEQMRFFHKEFKNWNYCFITSRDDFEKHFNLKATFKKGISNGKMNNIIYYFK
ncbi:class I SAM-dependent RNA methyltransferase [Oceanotoga sp. DSM 15011]|uniref:THUMP domain-containing class I SAM-dependent RNA methyltransferase n=1 Tax=Oceanotoga sp. DSM 15011 TaxID=2984951 RepID=UPI0021F44552|nr:class I SAM-dependent RNA methyltransferase [Oceanotoga sp. DSM 15011]UYP00522.1 class I SAM-dependent RNA methyltransferase [Oceanotoga sp. DSM 15011]